jgi:hypothetical protein
VNVSTVVAFITSLRAAPVHICLAKGRKGTLSAMGNAAIRRADIAEVLRNWTFGIRAKHRMAVPRMEAEEAGAKAQTMPAAPLAVATLAVDHFKLVGHSKIGHML